MAGEVFTCSACGREFSVKAEVLARYPGWQPTTCLKCRDSKSGKAGAKPKGASSSGRAAGGPRVGGGGGRANRNEALITVAEVLARYHDGPVSGVFTDGACTGNPGPGGWGAVFVHNNEIVAQRYGHEPHTTNNRMELTALIEGYRLFPKTLDFDFDVWTDSELCVRTINEWAAGWERNGWQRKAGPVKNLELVQELYALAKAQPRVKLRWIKAHSGRRWNEYADALATAYLRSEL